MEHTSWVVSWIKFFCQTEFNTDIFNFDIVFYTPLVYIYFKL
jgi:hypothetical protein